MKHVVLGKRNVSFTAKDGKEIAGVSLYLAYETDGVDGMAADKVFIPAAKLPKKEIAVGSDIDVLFNRYGKVEAINN